MLLVTHLRRTVWIRAGDVVSSLHHLECNVLAETLKGKYEYSADTHCMSYFFTESAATVIQFHHESLRTVKETNLAEDLLLCPHCPGELLVQEEGHLGAGPRVDTTSGHGDYGGTAGTLENRGAGPAVEIIITSIKS